jgi:phosphoribosylformylglycinamidine cyclo-ligase
MYRTFNMGIGMIVACAADDAERVTAMLQSAGETRVHLIGRIVEGEPGVVYGGM